jgi:excinuclease ABC subunit B
MYGDRITAAMRFAIDETMRRRQLQEAYNEEHGIVPRTVIRDISGIETKEKSSATRRDKTKTRLDKVSLDEIPKEIVKLREQMRKAADALEFEKAAQLRDQIRALSEKELNFLDPGAPKKSKKGRRRSRS